MTLLTLLAAVSAMDHFTPIQREIVDAPLPAPMEHMFSFDAPARPTFTEVEKQKQRERGATLMPLITKAFHSGSAEVKVTAGDYRIVAPQAKKNDRAWFLLFADLQRDADKPFIIDMTGVTLWFDFSDAQMPPGQAGMCFRNCRNIVLRGATLDRGTPGQIEGRITRIDREGNRFEIQPSAGIKMPTTYNSGDEQRVIPFKADGRFCAPLYELQPGIRKLHYKDITPSEKGRYWLTMRDPDLIERLHDESWKQIHGELGTLEVGDGLSCLYTSAAAIMLENSANITLHRVSIYIAKGGCTEIAGDGGHLWKDCYLGPRPGTNQWKGADGYLCRSTRYGSTLDNVTIRGTADDLANFHGIWGKVASVSGKTVTFERGSDLRNTLANARPGDRLRFIHRKKGHFLGEAKFVSAKEFTVTLDQHAAPFAEGQAEWPEHECAGWTVQNCRWEDNFQRLLIMSGPGMVWNNHFTRWGSNISLNTGMGLVGGIPSDITITGNTFTDVSPRPAAPSIHAIAHNASGEEGIPPIERLCIIGNTFHRTVGPVMTLIGLQSSTIERNKMQYQGATLPAANEAIQIQKSDEMAVKSNTITGP